jgi:hypothetical protein
MFDYLEIRNDNKYSKTISNDLFSSFFNDKYKIDRTNNRNITIRTDTNYITFTAILCNSDGNYNFNDNLIPNAINLIEVQLPMHFTEYFENYLLNILKDISDYLNWEVFDHETNTVIIKSGILQVNNG